MKVKGIKDKEYKVRWIFKLFGRRENKIKRWERKRHAYKIKL